MSNEVLVFGAFRLDPAERRLTRAGEPVALNARYLDALILLASRPGEFISRDRFMTEVWNGIPVTDEALTQCIRSLRRALGDDAAHPRLIETVPKHGYRFIGAETAPAGQAPPGAEGVDIIHEAPVPERGPSAGKKKGSPLLLTAAGLTGGAAAGLVGGIGYGLLAANDPPAGTGATSVLLVMTCLCLLVGAIGGLGVGSGIAVARQLSGGRLFPLMAGGAIGGLAAGALGRLIGLDAFALLVGSKPVAITGGAEGLLIGALAGVGAWFAITRTAAGFGQVALAGASLGAVAGLLVTAGGGQMMAGSLAVLAAAHPQAPLGDLLGGPILSPLTRVLTAATEGATFVAALSLAFALTAEGRVAGPPSPLKA